MTRCNSNLLLVVFLILATTGEARADLIYRLRDGTISPQGRNPLNLSGTLPLEISFTIKSGVVDTSSNVESAVFQASNITVLIDGIAATIVNPAPVQFRDNAGPTDFISWSHSTIEYQGHQGIMGFMVRFDDDLFHFPNAQAVAPNFGNTTTDFQGGSGFAENTFSDFQAGSRVTVSAVPEPSSFSLLAMVAFVGCNRRKR